MTKNSRTVIKTLNEKKQKILSLCLNVLKVNNTEESIITFIYHLLPIFSLRNRLVSPLFERTSSFLCVQIDPL